MAGLPLWRDSGTQGIDTSPCSCFPNASGLCPVLSSFPSQPGVVCLCTKWFSCDSLGPSGTKPPFFYVDLIPLTSVRLFLAPNRWAGTIIRSNFCSIFSLGVRGRGYVFLCAFKRWGSWRDTLTRSLLFVVNVCSTLQKGIGKFMLNCGIFYLDLMLFI